MTLRSRLRNLETRTYRPGACHVCGFRRHAIRRIVDICPRDEPLPQPDPNEPPDQLCPACSLLMGPIREIYEREGTSDRCLGEVGL